MRLFCVVAVVALSLLEIDGLRSRDGGDFVGVNSQGAIKPPRCLLGVSPASGAIYGANVPHWQLARGQWLNPLTPFFDDRCLGIATSDAPRSRSSL